ncbi:MAG: ECF transporter S component [Lachnospiraceae bacterium]|nr:ECF transporter S component [Lachnospiraceae bacterium]
MSDKTIKRMSITALFMAMTVILSTFSIPVPGGHLYFCDPAICLGALLLGHPGYAFVMGGFGSFIGDLFFNQASMFVSLITHGIQAAAIAFLSRQLFKSGSFHEKHPSAAGITARTIALLVGAVIMVTGYTIGRAYVYATPEYALLKLPFEILQALFGVAAALLLFQPLSSRIRF